MWKEAGFLQTPKKQRKTDSIAVTKENGLKFNSQIDHRMKLRPKKFGRILYWLRIIFLYDIIVL